MNKPTCKLFIFCFTSFLLPVNFNYAAGLEVLQQQCAEIGFKIKTPANGKCVLKLRKSVQNKEAKVAEEQRAIDLEQQANEARAAESEALRQQQAEMYELQQRSVAAQEQVAQAQADAVADQRRQRALSQFNRSVEMMTGTGAYAPAPSPRPITCNTFGPTTTCY